MEPLIKRTIEPKLLKLKEQFPVIALFGPRQSGKTTLVRRLFPQYRYINLESLQTREFAESDPKGFFERFAKEEGVIFDEVQKTPQLLSYIQLEVDESPEVMGRFILTGSQNLLLNHHVSQTLAGRCALLTLLPLSIQELREAKALSENATKAMFEGFYPRIHHLHQDPVVFAESYIKTYIERDVRDIKHITSLVDFQKFIRLCAARTGQLLNLSSLATEAGLAFTTVKSWLSILEASYIIFFLQPYFVNFNKRLVKMAKLYFYDPALVCNLLHITTGDALYTHYLRGSLFESMIIADLMKQRYNQTLPPNLYFWRDKLGNEIDCIKEEGSNIIAIEIKSTSTIHPEMFEGLKKWCALAEQNPKEGIIVYAGDEEQKRVQGHVLSWKQL